MRLTLSCDDSLVLIPMLVISAPDPMLRRLLNKNKGKNSVEGGSSNNVGGYDDGYSTEDLSGQFESLHVNSDDQKAAERQAVQEHEDIVRYAQNALFTYGQPTLHMIQAARIVADEGYHPTTLDEHSREWRPQQDTEQARLRRKSYRNRANEAAQRQVALHQVAEFLGDKIETYQKGTLINYAQQLLNLKAQIERVQELNSPENLPHAQSNNRPLIFHDAQSQSQFLKGLKKNSHEITKMFDQHGFEYEIIPGKRAKHNRESSSSHQGGRH